MNNNVFSYIVKPFVLGAIPGSLLCMFSESYLLAESVVLSALITFALRHKMHKEAQELGGTPFAKSFEVESGYVGNEDTVNTYFLRGNLLAGALMLGTYVLSIMIPETVSWFEVLASGVCLTIFFSAAINVALSLKGLPIPEPEKPVEFSKEKVFNSALYEQTGVAVWDEH